MAEQLAHPDALLLVARSGAATRAGTTRRFYLRVGFEESPKYLVKRLTRAG